jgi:hypothetical protein
MPHTQQKPADAQPNPRSIPRVPTGTRAGESHPSGASLRPGRMHGLVQPTTDGNWLSGPRPTAGARTPPYIAARAGWASPATGTHSPPPDGGEWAAAAHTFPSWYMPAIGGAACEAATICTQPPTDHHTSRSECKVAPSSVHETHWGEWRTTGGGGRGARHVTTGVREHWEGGKGRETGRYYMRGGGQGHAERKIGHACATWHVGWGALGTGKAPRACTAHMQAVRNSPQVARHRGRIVQRIVCMAFTRETGVQLPVRSAQHFCRRHAHEISDARLPCGWDGNTLPQHPPAAKPHMIPSPVR